MHGDRDLHPVGDVELGEQSRHVGFDRRFAQEQCGPHLCVRGTGPDRDRDLPFPVGERCQSVCGGAAAFCCLGITEPECTA